MKLNNRKTLFVIALLFVVFAKYANGMTGKSDESGFYPDPQAYTVIEAKFDDIDKAPMDLRGLPVILRGTTIFFTEKYFTFESNTYGSNNINGSCFEKIGNMLIIKPAGRFSRPSGEEIILWKKDDYWIMPYGENLKIHLKKAPLPDNFSDIKRRIDLAYNALIKQGYGHDNNCKLTEISGIITSTKSYTLVYDDLGFEEIISDGILDPDSPIDKAYMSRRNNDQLNETINSNNCYGNNLMYRFASSKQDIFNKRNNLLYIITFLTGNNKSDNMPCDEIIEIKKLYEDDISTAYQVKEKHANYNFIKWEGSHGFIIRQIRSNRDFLISDFHKERIKISEIPYKSYDN